MSSTSWLRCFSITSRTSSSSVVREVYNSRLALKKPVRMYYCLFPATGVLSKPKYADSSIFARPFSQSSHEEVSEPSLPTYVPRKGETVEVIRARLLYQSRKRGMLENGLLLSTFAACHLKSLTPAQLTQYDDIINRPSNDWQLYYWMTGKEETPADYDNEVMDMLKSHTRNDQWEARYHQPAL